MQERFRVEVDNIAFLGVYTPLASTQPGSYCIDFWCLW
jgi:hypothetical protein